MYFNADIKHKEYAGVIDKIKVATIKKLVPFVKDKNKHFNISLVGIGVAFNECKNINGVFPIKLSGNYFVDSKKYLLKVSGNKHLTLIIK